MVSILVRLLLCTGVLARIYQLQLTHRPRHSHKHRHHKRQNSAALINAQDFDFYVNVTVGNGQVFSLIVDTGSSDMFVRGPGCVSNAGDNSCSCDNMLPNPTSCVLNTLDPSLTNLSVTGHVGYGSADVNFNIFSGPVQFDGFTISNFPFGSAYQISGLGNSGDGILGLGYNSISRIAFKTGRDATIMDALGLSGSQQIFGVYMTNFDFQHFVNDVVGGEITFGGIDRSKFTGPITYVPLISQDYWKFNISSLTFSFGGSAPLSLAKSGGGRAISDSGTGQIYLDNSLADQINSYLGGVYSNAYGSYIVDCKWQNSSIPMIFTLRGVKYSIYSSSYIIPYNGVCLSGISRGGTDGLTAFSQFGQVWGRSYYTIYDKFNSRLGFAKAV
ncbi:hypothetical protein HDV06_003934 [Boothiomyces sp. JEL0866]|nr:hypothetical protein HDV06_003934 [Boothiomyces sp. JEL0866]